ncbi:Gfo/Idh/MocA family oxidoreductase [Granulicella sp. dw_53]|uniref:Gfo/Idh/MocA family protein n=1 Tax=Granulicella sp. dw_53 TaxID=2719792 RepID=UPI001BD356E8|nr:Gfo/Idh/MocA family oxidoreductase [Granulicella sp. dw_53]
MSQPPVRFAILGFGHHAVRRLLPAFAKSENAVLTGMWRRDARAAAQNCAEHNIPHCFATREELCASPDVDVVFITSPDSMHKEDMLLAVQHGKAVLCEKPLAMNGNDAEDMASAARAAGLLFGVGQNFRYNRSLEWIRTQIRAGAIGEPQLAYALYAYPANLAPRKWITDSSLACGGPIADVGVHCMDALRFVLDREIESIETLARTDAASGTFDAIANLQLEMTGGVYANVSVSARAPYRTLVEVTGSDGVLIAENGLTVDRPVELVLRRAGQLIENTTLDNADGYIRMLDGFASAFRGEGTFEASGDDGVKNMRALDAAYKSWSNQKREKV